MVDIWVEVAYVAVDGSEFLSGFWVPEGISAREALLQSDLGAVYPDLVLAAVPLGIFGRKIKDDTPLRDHDRVEVYRPLLADPKEARRRRAAQSESHQEKQS